MSTAVIPDPVAAVDPVLAEAQAAVDAAEATRIAAEQTAAVGVPDPATAADPPAPVVYDLKLPANSMLDASLVERTTAIARTLGLTPEAGQTVLDAVAKEIVSREIATAEANKPGGQAWVARDTEWKAASLHDPDVGGSPEKLALSVEKASQALAKYGSPELATFLTETGLGSHPAALKLLAKIGRAMSEPTSLVTGGNAAAAPLTLAERVYGKDGYGANKPAVAAP